MQVIHLKLLFILLLFFCLSGIVRTALSANRTQQTTVPQRLAEQIYNHLKDRYVIKKYTLDSSNQQYLVTFTLEDGTVMTYNAVGRLLRRLSPDGQETYFKKGYPVKILSPQGKVLCRTDYVWTTADKIKRSITHRGKYTIVSFYDDQGNIQYETCQGPRGLIYRYNFSWSDNRCIYSYFETRSQDGITDFYRVSAVTGLLVEHWRVTGGMHQVWDEPYTVFIHLLLQRFRKDYADRTQLKKDSLNHTRGDVLLRNLIPEKIYPLERFVDDLRRKRIVFEEEWKYIDCSDIRLRFPVVELIEKEKVLVQKVKVKGEIVYAWVPERKQWERYPFDPRVEELIPTSMRGDACLESRFKRTEWQVVPGKVMEMVYSVRLIIPPHLLAQQRLRLSQHLHDDQDFDDLYAVMQAPNQIVTPTPPALAGEIVKDLTPAEIETFQIELAYQMKNKVQKNPQMKQRDSSQLTQAELVVRALKPEHMLSRRELQQQLGKLRRFRHDTFDQIVFKDLEIFLPGIQKRRLYRIIDRVKRDHRVIKVWKSDSDHPMGGYWRPYALRPSRDELYRKGSRLFIRVDEGRFKWELMSRWKSQRVSGSVFLAKPGKNNSSSQPVLTKVTMASDRKKIRFKQSKQSAAGLPACRKELQTKLQAALPGMWHGSGMFLKLIWWTARNVWRGGSGKISIQETTNISGQQVHLYELHDWWGKVKGYQRLLEQAGRVLVEEKYNKEGRLLSATDQRGNQYYVTYRTDKSIEVTRYHAARKQIYHFASGQLMAITLSDGKRLEYDISAERQQVRWLDKKGQWIFEKIYSPAGKQLEMRFIHGEKISYHYHPKENQVQLYLINNQGEKAQILLDKKGKVLHCVGNGKIIHFALKQLDFIRPDTCYPLTIQFSLNLI